MKDHFIAATQYSDLKGTAAADNHDNQDINEYLRQKTLIGADEIVHAVTFFSGEVHAKTQEKEIYVSAYVAPPQTTLEFRQVRFNLKLNEFFGLFKRFEVKLSLAGDLTGKTVSITEETSDD